MADNPLAGRYVLMRETETVLGVATGQLMLDRSGKPCVVYIDANRRVALMPREDVVIGETPDGVARP